MNRCMYRENIHYGLRWSEKGRRFKVLETLTWIQGMPKYITICDECRSIVDHEISVMTNEDIDE